MSWLDALHGMSAVHFLRPGWLWALLAAPAWWRVRQRRRNPWHGVVDAHLLPTLLQGERDAASRWPWMLALIGYLLVVSALAGPSWRRASQPLWETRTPLVVALDLSSATLAADLAPSRLAQARAKLAALLRERRGGQVALVAFAGDAFTVAPLTDDAANVVLFLDALEPGVMPVDGQRADRAIAWSATLIERAAASGSGSRAGEIVLLTDHADTAAISAAADAAQAGHRVHALGLGTAAGAAYRRPGGEIARARLDASSLRELARTGRGRYSALGTDGSDLETLGLLRAQAQGDASGSRQGLAWRDEGYWLLPAVMLLALLLFRRRGGALALVAVCFCAPLQPALASDLWRRPDQTEHARLETGNAAYRRGDFAEAIRAYDGLPGATAHYNRGNALAKAGHYADAIAAYDAALRQQPDMADALANRRAVEQAMKRQSASRPPSQSSGEGKSGEQGGSGESQEPGESGESGKPASQAPGDMPPQPGRGTPPAPAQPPSPGDDAGQAAPEPLQAADTEAQQQANRAQSERMQQALRQSRAASQQERAPAVEETPEQRERRLANEAWLRRVPDEPGGLLRAKFRLEHERRLRERREEK